MSQSCGRADYNLFVSQLRAEQAPANSEHGQTDRHLNSSPFFPSQGHVVPSARSLLDSEKPLYHGVGGSVSKESEAEGTKQQLVPEGIYRSSMPLLMPPKRDLPFPKPREITQVPSFSASNVPIVPNPAVRSNSAGKSNEIPTETTITPIPKPAKKRVAQRKAPEIKRAQGVLAVEESVANTIVDRPVSANAAVADELSPLAGKSAAAIRPASAASGLKSKVTATKKRSAASAPIRPASVTKRPKMVSQSTQTQAFPIRNSHVAADPAAVGPVTPEAPPEAPPEDYLSALDNFVTKHKGRPAPKELWGAPAYAESDEEARQILLNDFICDNLENAEFLQLCQDAEKAWRMIGLGM